MRPDWKGAERVAEGNGAERRNPGKPFHDELLFAKDIIHLQKAAVQKIM